MAKRFPGFVPQGEVLALSKPFLLVEFDPWLYVGHPGPAGGVRWERRAAEIDIQWLVRSRKEIQAMRRRYWYFIR